MASAKSALPKTAFLQGFARAAAYFGSDGSIFPQKLAAYPDAALFSSNCKLQF
jgi:hypothetical protein